MKKIYGIIITCILINTVMKAQPCGFSSFPNSGFAVQSIPGSSVVTPAVTMGKYLLVNVYQGRNYTFSMCGLAGQFDAVMTIYQNASGTLIGYDDDFCGGGLGSGSLSQVSFVSPITGYVRVVLTQYPCLVSANSCAVRIIDNSPTAAPSISCPSNITVAAINGQCGANVNYPSASAGGNPAPTITYSHSSGTFFPIGTTTVTATANNGVNPNATCTFTITVTGGADTDNDGIGNACDTDDDNDGVLDVNDNCPLVVNTNQADNDNDGQGDACDPDDDNDGIADTNDNCPLIANANQLDTDNDGIGNTCDPDDDNDGIADPLDCAPLDATKWQQALLYVDNDNDNYTNGQQMVCYGATIPTGYKVNSLGSDCNDGNAAAWLEASFYIDFDNDGYTIGQQTLCYGVVIPPGYKANSLGSDCNDGNPAVWQSTSLYIDNDNDGYTNGQQNVCYGATIPTGYKASSLGSDCNDNNSAVHPGATEVCNDIDDDCDGVIDNGFINTMVTCPFTGTITKNLASGCVYTVSGNEFNASVIRNCGPLSYTLSGATTGSGVSLANVQLNTGTTTVTWSATNANDQIFSCSFNVYVVPQIPTITCPANIAVPATNGQCGAVVNYTTPPLPILCANNDELPPTTTTFNYSGQIIEWVVPAGVTSITMEAWGAQGKSAQPGFVGGKGARMKGTFNVTPGDHLLILVGQEGQWPGCCSGGGGGGTFIVKVDPTSTDVIATGAFAGYKVRPLLIAGGGGGTRAAASTNGFPGVTSNFGTTGSCSSNTGSGGGIIKNSASGLGGSSPCVSWGSGGGGFRGNGQSDASYGTGGFSFLNGAIGGSNNCGTGGIFGGFGSGGSGGGCWGGGGGGGYSGGDGGFIAGGGGSFNLGTDQDNSPGVKEGNGSVTITYGSGNQPGVSQTSGLPSGANFPVGTTTNTFLITDAFGQTSNCSFTVTVNDEQAPTVVQPDDITVSNTTDQCSASVNFLASASDNCSVTSLKYYLNYNTANQEEISFPKTFAVGSYVVTVVAKDAANNTTTKQFTVTVNDTQKPNVTAGIIGYCYQTVAAAEAAALEATIYSDNCSSFEELDVNVSTVGTCSAVITVIVTDAAGNSRSVTYNTRIDGTAPVLSATPANTTVNCHQVPPVPAVTASDNCDGDVNVTFTPTSTKGSDPSLSSYYNYTITRKWFATDGCGNTVEHVQTITVQDVTAPTLACPANIVVSNEAGLCSVEVSFSATSSDLCSTPTVKYYLYYGTPQQVEITSPRIFAVGSYTVKVISTDPSGNSNNCSFTVTVKDDEKPVVTKGTIENCYKTVAAAQAAALAATTYSDNCTSNAQLNVTVGTVGDCSAVITVTVKDGANNSHFATYNTRIDNTSPVLSLTPASVTVNCQTVPPVPAVTANDNCDGGVSVTFTPTSTQGGDPAQSSYYNYTITRKWFATDGCGNSVEHIQVITVQDVTEPDITCPADKLDVPFDFGQLYATIPIGTATATDNCANSNITIAGTRSDNVAISNQQYPLGQTTVLWTATDPSDNSDECTQTITVRKRNTAVTYTGDMIDNKICVQYSDIINLKAKLTDNEGLVTPNNISGRTITFQLLSGTTVLRSKSATTDANGIALDTFKIEQAPGMYSVKTIFTGDAYFNGSYDLDNCEVKQEDAIVEYNGSQYFTTASSTTMVGSVTLAASVNDIDDGNDKRGDIRKAKATFRDGGPGGSVLGAANLPVGLVNPGILTNGISATTQNNITLNSNDASSGGKIFQVWIGTSDHYTGAEAGLTPVTLALPGQDFVTGGGHLVVTNSAGTYAGTLNSKMNFGFTMKWNKSGKNLQGNINIVFRKWQLYSGVWQWRVYQMKSNAINSMAVVEVGANGQPVSTANPAAFRKAIINTKANLKDVTDPLNSIDLGGNHNLVLDAWDHITANGGISDKISVTLMGATTNELLFSSSWSSNATAAQTITGGNINVRNGSGSSATTKTTTAQHPEMEGVQNKTKDQFIVKAYPNPSEHQFTLTISSNLNEAVQVQIYDAAGRKLETISARANELIRFGEKLKTGIYFAQVSQGHKQETVKLIKQ